MSVDLTALSKTPRAKALRKHCIDYVRSRVKGKRVAALLSGGVDSNMCLFAALDCGLQPTVYTFMLDGHESRDFRTARRTADYFGLDFVPVILSTDILELQQHVWNVYHKFLPEFKVGKSTVECTWPIARTLDVIDEPFWLLGFGGDPPYCSMRKQRKAYLAGEYESMLTKYYTYLHNDLQLKYHERYLQSIRKKTTRVAPLNDSKMLTIFQGFDPFDKRQNPTQKGVSRAAFWEYFSQVRIYGQQGFQKGDTGIAEHFESLMETDWYAKGKTVISVYNRVQYAEVQPPVGCKPSNLRSQKL